MRSDALHRLRENHPGVFQLARWAYHGSVGTLSGLRGTMAWRGQWNTYRKSHPVLKVHVGCGPNILKGWFNTDRSALSADVAYLNLEKRLPFDTGAIDYVFSEHVIEHVPLATGVKFFRETFRVLKPGGTLRISTPDLRQILALVSDELPPLERQFVDFLLEEIPGAVGGHPAFAVNHFVRAWGHVFIYDFPTIKSVLENCGFREVRRCAVGESNDPELRGIESHGSTYPDPRYNLIESFVVEATRPA